MATTSNLSSTELKTLVYGDSKWRDALNARTGTPISKFHAGMRYYFKSVDPRDYIDPLFIQLRQVKLDILKFDDWRAKLMR